MASNEYQPIIRARLLLERENDSRLESCPSDGLRTCLSEVQPIMGCGMGRAAGCGAA
ncbi:unnamed protein product [Dovyalis caffra]|uniref:Uncharacterized protein n=1 Tax=Dovyalis caffra TaxID=77055 RepID=A0AAV1RGP1_9ROSI|nr:unnamed protein product [Dovyalis caffra]